MHIGHERGTTASGHPVSQRKSPQFSGPRLVIKREKSQCLLWLPEVYVHIPYQMSTRCPHGHECGISPVRASRVCGHANPGHRGVRLANRWTGTFGTRGQSGVSAAATNGRSQPRIAAVRAQELVFKPGGFPGGAHQSQLATLEACPPTDYSLLTARLERRVLADFVHLLPLDSAPDRTRFGYTPHSRSR